MKLQGPQWEIAGSTEKKKQGQQNERAGSTESDSRVNRRRKQG